MKSFVILFASGLLVASLYVAAVARPQYRNVVKDLDAKTDAEKKVQADVKENKCNACHIPKKSKKMRNEYGKKMHKALGGGDPEKYKYDKEFWKKTDGKYSDAAVKSVRDAINAVAKEDKKE